jgi:hypothetical protein
MNETIAVWQTERILLVATSQGRRNREFRICSLTSTPRKVIVHIWNAASEFYQATGLAALPVYGDSNKDDYSNLAAWATPSDSIEFEIQLDSGAGKRIIERVEEMPVPVKRPRVEEAVKINIVEEEEEVF